MINHTYIWYEVRVETMSSKDYSTLEDAKIELEEMKKGYPLNPRMTEENHSFWIRQGEKAVINKVTEISERVI